VPAAAELKKVTIEPNSTTPMVMGFVKDIQRNLACRLRGVGVKHNKRLHDLFSAATRRSRYGY
jgi:hypothetical protein